MLAASELEKIKRRIDNATPGPWRSYIEGRDPPGRGYDSFIQTASEDIYLTGATEADQDFIAHARQDVEILLDEIARLKKEIDRPRA